MASLAFATTSSTVTYANTGDMHTAGKWVQGDDDSMQIGAPKRRRQKIRSNGVNGAGTKDHGSGDRALSFRVIYVEAAENDLQTAMDDDETNLLENGPITLTIAGKAYGRVFVLDFVHGNIQESGGYYRCEVRIIAEGLE